MTDRDRSSSAGRAGQGLPAAPGADRAAALAAGLAAYERGDFFEAHEQLEPAWMGTDDLAERALLQGLIKLAAAYVHDVRGNPAGIARNLEGARRAAGRGAPRHGRRRATSAAARPRGAHRRDRRCGWPTSPPTRRADPRPARACRGAPREPCPARSRPIDVAEAERRLREDPDRPLLLDVRETNEFVEVRAPGAVLVPTSAFMARVGELPADRPLLVDLPRRRPVGGGRRLPDPGRADGRGQRGRRDGRLGAGRAAGPARPARAGRGRPAGRLSRPLALRRPRWRTRADDRPGLRLVGERPADEDQEDEVDGADAGRVQVAELLADLAVDLQPGHGRADQAELEERALRRGVGADARGEDRRSTVVAADEDDVRAGDDRRRALEARRRQVADVEVLPLGDVAGRRRDRPVELGLGAAAVVAADEVERAVGAPSPTRSSGRPAGWRALLTSQRMTLPASGLAGSPAAAALPNAPRWTAPTGPLASLPPYSQR